jgi:hypothetical protein
MCYAVAAAACEMIENETQVDRGVEMLLLVKDEGVWRIVSHARDSESPVNRIPPGLLGRAAEETSLTKTSVQDPHLGRHCGMTTVR